jgi:hypothetical protein
MPKKDDVIGPTTAPSVTEWRPMPDPAAEKTDRQIENAIMSLRDLVDTRLTAMDKAIVLLQQQANRSPTIGEVFARFEERFVRIDQSFIERDRRTDQLTLASSTAIAAALQAQKEAAGETQKSSSAAIAKSEAATGESIKQLQTLFQTSIAGLSNRIDDVKSRLDKGEGSGLGSREAVLDHRWEKRDNREETVSYRGALYGIIGIVIAIGSFTVAVFGHFMK